MLVSAPEDYGFTGRQTLAHEVEGAVPEGFESFWVEFREEVSALPSSWRGSIDGEVNQLLITSARSVRVAARLTLPAGDPTGLVLTIDGPDAPPDFLPIGEPWSGQGLATLRLRLRGYPPSTMDIEDLRQRWIIHKLGLADSWIIRGAVSDVMQAFRCARRHFGPDLPIALHGEAIGAGLAVIAAAQLACLGDSPARLAIALPELGDWRWRSRHYCSGPGGLVNEALVASRGESERLLESLALFDAAFHAQGVESPVLCRLAERDDTVPAPAAAAVFNALPGGRKWRFVTLYGHFEGGLADARRRVQFGKAELFFLNLTRSAGELMERPPADLGPQVQ